MEAYKNYDHSRWLDQAFKFTNIENKWIVFVLVEDCFPSTSEVGLLRWNAYPNVHNDTRLIFYIVSWAGQKLYCMSQWKRKNKILIVCH